MKDKRTLFEKQCLNLSLNDRVRVEEFMKALEERINLPKKDANQIRRDFESAILHYMSNQVPITEALKRLSLDNLGDFYNVEPSNWYPLDDAAKIYPLSMNPEWMAMFRLSAYMDTPVVPQILQMALHFTIKRFPFFATTIKQGFFWHYIDATKRLYPVQFEHENPCAPMRVSSGKARSFRVIYYDNRISVEFFHILTDGTGGMIFLKTLVAEYLNLLYAEDIKGEGILNIDESPSEEESENAFSKAPKVTRHSGFVDKPAVQLSGKLSRIHPCRIIQFEMDSALLNSTAKALGGTITALMLSIMTYACRVSSKASHQNIQIQVPVNMRKFYPSKTIRNFAMYCSVRIPRSDNWSVKQMIPMMTGQLKTNASQDSMTEMIASTNALVSLLRWVPMLIKKPVAKMVYGVLGDKVFTNTLSNLGVVTLPEKMAAHVKKMDFILGTGVTNRASCSMVTTSCRTVFTIAKLTADPSFEEAMHEQLTILGLNPTVTGSEIYER